MIEDYFDGLVQELFINSAISSFKVLRREIGKDDGYIRIKCKLKNNDILEFAEYIQTRKNKIHLETYSFHWQDTKGHLIKRWDNVSHHKELDTFPHHIHLLTGGAISSTPMTLKSVLREIEKVLPIIHEREQEN
ncbi:MAG: DUF6516 family protein [Planctomycetota bacterium]